MLVLCLTPCIDMQSDMHINQTDSRLVQIVFRNSIKFSISLQAGTFTDIHWVLYWQYSLQTCSLNIGKHYIQVAVLQSGFIWPWKSPKFVLQTESFELFMSTINFKKFTAMDVEHMCTNFKFNNFSKPVGTLWMSIWFKT